MAPIIPSVVEDQESDDDDNPYAGQYKQMCFGPGAHFCSG